jgi:hypothetical protein
LVFILGMLTGLAGAILMSFGFLAVAFGPAASGFTATALVAGFLSSDFLVIVWGIGFCATTDFLGAGVAGFATIFFAPIAIGGLEAVFAFTGAMAFLGTGLAPFLAATGFATGFFATDFFAKAVTTGFLGTGLATVFLATGFTAAFFWIGFACFLAGAAFLTGGTVFLGAVFFAAGFTAFFEVAMLLAFFYIHN